MPSPRPFALIGSTDQWRRCGHDGTTLLDGVVQLSWGDTDATNANSDFHELAAGLAFDSHCRLFHSIPGEGRVERLLWAATDPLEPHKPQQPSADVFAQPEREKHGDFTEKPRSGQPLEPRALAVDADDLLFVGDTAGRCVWVIDLESRRVVRRIALPGRPLDLVANGRTIYAALDDPAAIVSFTRASEPRDYLEATPVKPLKPSRLAVSSTGDLFVLDDARTATARVLHMTASEPPKAVPGATDIEFQFGNDVTTRECDDGGVVLVVSRQPEADLLRFCVKPSGWEPISPLAARRYDGLGIVRTPDGRIGFWTDAGFRHSVAPRLKYEPNGTVISYRLDSGEFHKNWGRVFLDACIPRETSIRMHCLTADEPPESAEWPRGLPKGFTDPPHAELSPPMPPLELLPTPLPAGGLLHLRETGRELPFVSAAPDGFATYETPVLAPPGRYLWIVLHLAGNTRTTPRVRSLRAEHPAHDYLQRLPKVFARDADAASFLLRYLSLFEGVLGELEGRSDARHALLDPRSAPAGTLPWLAGFVGLLLDERWSEPVRRQLIAESAWLFRFRGTIPGLARFLEIVIGRSVVIVESYRLRGIGVASVGGSGSLESSSILGGGFRVGGAVGETASTGVGGTLDDAFATHAHRFSVIVPGSVGSQMMDVIRYILDVHRPAHTVVEVCSADAGMRVGIGLHLDLTSVIGRTGGFRPLRIGEGGLGREMLLGNPRPGTLPEASRLGRDTLVG